MALAMVTLVALHVAAPLEADDDPWALAEQLRRAGYAVAAAQLHGELGCHFDRTHRGRVSLATVAALALQLGDVVWLPGLLTRCYSDGLAHLAPEQLDQVNLLVGARALVAGHADEAAMFLGAVRPSARGPDHAALFALARTLAAPRAAVTTATASEARDGPLDALTRLLDAVKRERADARDDAALGAAVDSALDRAEPELERLARERAAAIPAERARGRWTGAVRLRPIAAPAAIVVPPRIPARPRPAWVAAMSPVHQDAAAGLAYARGDSGSVRNEELAISTATSRGYGALCRVKAVAEGQSPRAFFCVASGPYALVELWRDPSTGTAYALVQLPLALLPPAARTALPEASAAALRSPADAPRTP